MTPSPQHRDQAKALIHQLGHRDIDWQCCISDEEAVNLTSKALAEAEQRGKEAAGNRLDTVSAQWEYHVGIAEHLEWCRKMTP